MRRILRVILLIESSRASGRSLLRGIADYARHHGRWAFYWEPGGLEKAWPRIRAIEADGIILRDTEMMEDLLAYRLPTVVVGHSRQQIPGVANLISDSAAVGRLGAEHLLNTGLQHFAFCGFDEFPWSQDRAVSFRQRLAAAGRTPHLYSSTVRLSWREELQLLADWVRSLPKPVGILACNDDRGQQVVEACKLARLAIPEQVAVLGADNDDLVCELSDPPMSSVAINFERAGYESARLLDRLMRGRRSRAGAAARTLAGARAVQNRVIIAPATHVVARQSTDLFAVQDAAVAAALRFIRQHAGTPLRVGDVATAAGLSRRVLEKRFRQALNRSVLREIRRARTERICQLLVETNQTIARIAETLGFAGPEHFARYFRKERNLTPLAYRQRFAKW